MDGARFANAVASLNASPAEATWKSGVDVLCFGGTKNGIAIGEAVVFFDREMAREFDYRCKQGGQLASKMRFLSAPWTGMLRDGAWLKHARHANAMAKRLEIGLRSLPQIQVAYSVDSNSVFAKIPKLLVDAMHARGWKFYTHVGGWQEARLMCSWDTTQEDVCAFLEDLHHLSK
jgi:threonine aldolase